MTVQHLGAHVPSIRASHPSNSMRVVAPRAAVVAHSPASRRVTSPTACAGLVSSSSCPSRVLLTSTRTSIHAHQNRPERCVTHLLPMGDPAAYAQARLSAPDAEGTVHTRRPHHQSPHPRNPPTTRSAPPLTSHAAAKSLVVALLWQGVTPSHRHRMLVCQFTHHARVVSASSFHYQ
jgi:hypothetical protein